MKTINVSKETTKMIQLLKYELNMKSADAVIKYLYSLHKRK